MRIISQNGCYDIPYKQVIIQRFETEIYFLNANLAGIGDTEDICIAKYSTEEKAIKVMEMLNNAYCGIVDGVKIKELSEKEMKEIEERIKNTPGQLNIRNPKIKCKIWKFPRDDEVEV